MIRFCDEEVITVGIEEVNSMTKSQWLLFFLGNDEQNREKIILVLDENGGFYGTTDYNTILFNKPIKREYLVMSESFWSDAKELFEQGAEGKVIVFDNEGNPLTFCYNDDKYEECDKWIEVLEGMDSIPEAYLIPYPKAELICIHEVNEFAWRMYKLFEKCRYNVCVIGEEWKWFGINPMEGYNDYPKFAKYHIYAEGTGNYGEEQRLELAQYISPWFSANVKYTYNTVKKRERDKNIINIVIWGADKESCLCFKNSIERYGEIDRRYNILGVADDVDAEFSEWNAVFYEVGVMPAYERVLTLDDIQGLFQLGELDGVFLAGCSLDFDKWSNEPYVSMCSKFDELGIPVLNKYVDCKNLGSNVIAQYKWDNVEVRALSDMYVVAESWEAINSIAWIYDSNKRVIRETFNTEWSKVRRRPWAMLYKDATEVTEIEECCVLAREWNLNFWHFTYEAMTKVHLMEKNGYKGKYMLYESTFAKELIRLYNMEPDRIIWLDRNKTEQFRINKLYCVEGVEATDDRTSKLLNELSDKILSNIDLVTRAEEYPKRLFIKRIGTRRLIENQELLEKYGFTTFTPEEHSFEEQIKHFYHADIVFGPHGAGNTNSMYMRKGTSFIETFGADYSWACFTPSMTARGIDYHMVVQPTMGAFKNENGDYMMPDYLLELTLKRVCENYE